MSQQKEIQDLIAEHQRHLKILKQQAVHRCRLRLGPVPQLKNSPRTNQPA